MPIMNESSDINIIITPDELSGVLQDPNITKTYFSDPDDPKEELNTVMFYWERVNRMLTVKFRSDNSNLIIDQIEYGRF